MNLRRTERKSCGGRNRKTDHCKEGEIRIEIEKRVEPLYSGAERRRSRTRMERSRLHENELEGQRIR